LPPHRAISLRLNIPLPCLNVQIAKS
jgi:hypothetical protein